MISDQRTLAAANRFTSAVGAAVATVPAGSERILVIEDDRAVQKLSHDYSKPKGSPSMLQATAPPVWRCSGQRLRPCSCWT